MLSDRSKLGQSLSELPGLTCTTYPNAPISAAGVLTTLDTVTLPEGVFAVDGDFMEFEYAGGFAGGNQTEVFLYFGTDAIFHSDIIDPANESWSLRGKMVRTGPTTQFTISRLSTSTLSVVKLNSTTIAFGPAVQLALKGVGADEGDVNLSACFRMFYFNTRTR